MADVVSSRPVQRRAGSGLVATLDRKPWHAWNWKPWNFRPWLVFALLIAGWVWASHQPGSISLILLSPGAVFRGARELLWSGDLWLNYRMSVERVVAGFSIGAGLGLLLGAALALSAWFDRLVGPVFNAVRQVPVFGWVPLVGLWFGLGETSKAVIIVLAALYPVALQTYEGLRRAPQQYIEVAEMFLLTRRQKLFRVLAPSATPLIMTGLKQGLSFAWMAVVGAELFMSAAPGIGNMMGAARGLMRTDVVFLSMFVIGATGFLMNYGMTLIERRLLRWRPEHVR